MDQKGFTLVEMIVVVAICVTLMGLATISFSNWNMKNKIETQFRNMYADLMDVRSQALYRKRERSVRITTTGFSVYSSKILTTDSTSAPVKQKTMRVAVTTNPANLQIDFDQMGVASLYKSGVTALDNYSTVICVQANASKAFYNSIIVSKTRIQMGSLSGTGCSSANITPQ